MPEKPVIKPPGSGSPHRRNPELYCGQIWVDEKMFALVRMFAENNKISIKAAAYQLLAFGLHFYSVTQLRMEQARLTHTPPEHTQIYSVNDLGRLLAHIHQYQKVAAKEDAAETKHPF